ncbi:hypothetical protein BDBG_16612 [Blastomyces gilchristii SLH14081]|uniref:Uncharacterized protein n=1 Tax=Blastomyces gilchristii (strain SLH14081) TaxID=559298 RepID=A0A179UEA9_BLAGS|nr:uncharacterized protein BDBG_16612 [Blastomyces gilchristii SLH14081]OAT06355.1 hypothetical protein BDBG_16612 [Blastomyces gilchristii SLH14081]
MHVSTALILSGGASIINGLIKSSSVVVVVTKFAGITSSTLAILLVQRLHPVPFSQNIYMPLLEVISFKSLFHSPGVVLKKVNNVTNPATDPHVRLDSSNWLEHQLRSEGCMDKYSTARRAAGMPQNALF